MGSASGGGCGLGSWCCGDGDGGSCDKKVLSGRESGWEGEVYGKGGLELAVMMVLGVGRVEVGVAVVVSEGVGFLCMELRALAQSQAARVSVSVSVLLALDRSYPTFPPRHPVLLCISWGL